MRAKPRSLEWIGSRGFGTLLLISTTLAAIFPHVDLHEPPRFDGAGYAVLAEALATHHGYRAIDHPDEPRHGHFPPGYPLALAFWFRALGRSVVVAHLFSVACTVVAVLAAWLWFRRLFSSRSALLLGLALAVNWTWGRNGGAIRSEPLFLVISQVAILMTVRVGWRGGASAGISLGLCIAAAVITRQVGVCLAAAIAVDLFLRGRRRIAFSALTTAVIMVAPWLAWLLTVESSQTQASLLFQMLRGGDRISQAGHQAIFYTERLPDQWVGPFVESALVFRRSLPIVAAATIWVCVASIAFVWGAYRLLGNRRRRLGALIPLATLPLLIAWPFTEAGRFLLPLVPGILLAIVEGVAMIWTVVRRVFKLRRDRFPGSIPPRVLAASFVLLVSLPYPIYDVAAGRAEARRRSFDAFDAACSWLSDPQRAAGTVLTRHPGEIFWQTGRHALAPVSEDLDAVARQIDEYHVVYLLIDESRYANEPASPLTLFAARCPERVQNVWSRVSGQGSITIFRVISTSDPRNGASRNPRSDGISGE